MTMFSPRHTTANVSSRPASGCDCNSGSVSQFCKLVEVFSPPRSSGSLRATVCTPAAFFARPRGSKKYGVFVA